MVKEDFFNEIKWFLDYYESKMTEIKSKIWFEIFEKETKENFHEALMAHIQYDDQPFFPAPGKITARIKDWKIQ
jgi:hypothetical protein